MLFGFGEAMIAMPYLTALMFLSLGVSAALIFTAPIITTALGATFLRERVGVYRWGAVVLGFFGVVPDRLGRADHPPSGPRPCAFNLRRRRSGQWPLC